MAGTGRGNVDQRLGQLSDARLPTRFVVVNDADEAIVPEQQIVGIVVAVDDKLGKCAVPGETGHEVGDVGL